MNKSSITNPVHTLEVQEIISKLRENGHGDLVDCLLDNEGAVYTKKGRLNKSSTCRKMGWKNKQLEDTLRLIRELLHDDFE
jgi:hypothetical protein